MHNVLDALRARNYTTISARGFAGIPLEELAPANDLHAGLRQRLAMLGRDCLRDFFLSFPHQGGSPEQHIRALDGRDMPPSVKSFHCGIKRIVKVALEGKAAKTEMQVVERFPGATLIEAKPVSGRTHQIRVHTQHIGHPILGDSKYQNEQSQAVSATAGLKRLFLHARAIAFELGGERYELECPLDAELESVLSRLRGQR